MSTQQTYEVLDKDQTWLPWLLHGRSAERGKYTMLDDDKHVFPPYQISLRINTNKPRSWVRTRRRRWSTSRRA